MANQRRDADFYKPYLKYRKSQIAYFLDFLKEGKIITYRRGEVSGPTDPWRGLLREFPITNLQEILNLGLNVASKIP